MPQALFFRCARQRSDFQENPLFIEEIEEEPADEQIARAGDDRCQRLRHLRGQTAEKESGDPLEVDDAPCRS